MAKLVTLSNSKFNNIKILTIPSTTLITGLDGGSSTSSSSNSIDGGTSNTISTTTYDGGVS
jgi:hypothetical protein